MVSAEKGVGDGGVSKKNALSTLPASFASSFRLYETATPYFHLELKQIRWNLDINMECTW